MIATSSKSITIGSGYIIMDLDEVTLSKPKHLIGDQQYELLVSVLIKGGQLLNSAINKM